MKTIYWLMVFLFLSACSESSIEKQYVIFGLPAEIMIFDTTNEITNKAVAEFGLATKELNNLLARTSVSELGQLNSNTGQMKVSHLSKPMEKIMQDMQQLPNNYLTYFMPTSGELLDIWGFTLATSPKTLPPAEKIRSFVASAHQLNDFKLSGTTLVPQKSFKFDLDGYDKGHAIDVLIAGLKKDSIKNALININGNIGVLGEKSGRPWKVGIQHPRKPGPIATIELSNDESLMNALDYEQYYLLGNKRYNHIMDYRVGYPVMHTQAVVVIGERSAISSAKLGLLAKILFIAGPKGFSSAVKKYEIKNAMLIDESGEVFITSSLARRIEFNLPKPIIHEQ